MPDFFTEKHTYAPLRPVERNGSENGSACRHDGKCRRMPWWSFPLLTTINLALFMGSILILVHTDTMKNDLLGPRRTREYSAMQEAVGARSPLEASGEFSEPSIYRGTPNATIDAAWDALDHVKAMSIPKAEYERLGKIRDSNVILEDGGYLASIEAFHQMHCVNVLRKYSYLDYYLKHEPEFFASPRLRMHTDHCIEMLRQSIMCSADLHVITYDWVEVVDFPWPDFSISRNCRNYDALHDWAVERTISVGNESGQLPKPKGIHYRPVEGAAEHGH